MERGRKHLLLKAYDKALLDFDQAVLLAPNSVNALYFRGYNHSQMKNKENAEKDFRRVVTLKPVNAAEKKYQAGAKNYLRDMDPANIARRKRRASKLLEKFTYIKASFVCNSVQGMDGLKKFWNERRKQPYSESAAFRKEQDRIARKLGCTFLESCDVTKATCAHLLKLKPVAAVKQITSVSQWGDKSVGYIWKMLWEDRGKDNEVYITLYGSYHDRATRMAKQRKKQK